MSPGMEAITISSQNVNLSPGDPKVSWWFELSSDDLVANFRLDLLEAREAVVRSDELARLERFDDVSEELSDECFSESDSFPRLGWLFSRFAFVDILHAHNSDRPWRDTITFGEAYTMILAVVSVRINTSS